MKKKKLATKPIEVFTAVAQAPDNKCVLLQMYIDNAPPSGRRKRNVANPPQTQPGMEAASLKDAALLCIEQALAYAREHLAKE